MKVCSIDGCLNKIHGRSYCPMHYYRFAKWGDPNYAMYTVGESRLKNCLYSTYKNMKSRCYNKNIRDYKNYGGRGIIVCDEWLGPKGFTNFCKDMGSKPDSFTLDRVNSDLNYCKENCRRASWYTQGSNKRNSNKVTGVCFCKKTSKRHSYIYYQKKQISLGFFLEYDNAVKARKDAELHYNIYK